MIRLIAVLVLLAAPSVLHAQAVDGTLKKILDSKTVTIAYRTDALPFSYEGEGKQPAGYTVELCKRIASSLERQLKVQPLQIKWVAATSQNRLELVQKRQADMECGATTVSLSRMGEVDFSSFVFVDATGVLVRNAAAAKSFKDLAGKRIAVVGSTTNQAAVDAAVKKLAVGTTVVPVKNRDEAIAALAAGSVDAFASDKVLLLGLGAKMKDPSQYTLLPDDLSFEPYAIVLPRGDANFRLAVNRALAEIYRSNEIVEIFRRTFGADLEPTLPLVVMYGLGAFPN
ncbi:MAG TPA: amino acid ABC transporter substrate-binding protein [Burkholderiales bacterium]|nr:amino acid ABC transporter substrate-binding protein [Burkholderiales bacterium]